MNAKTIWRVVRSGRLPAFVALSLLALPIYRACFLVSAAQAGLLRALASRPLPRAEIAAAMGIEQEHHDGLTEWLAVGLSLGILRRRGSGYGLKSRLARALARPDHDDILALLEELISLHQAVILQTPRRLREGRLFTLADVDGDLIARASRTVEPFIHEAVEAQLGGSGPLRLLEIGCGSGAHIRHAAEHNAQLTALGIELDPAVAEVARGNLQRWGLSGRVAVEAGDIREREPEPGFDVATLHQNIYYFPVSERVALLRHVRGFLRPGGQLLLTTSCRGGSPLLAVLSLWGAVTAGSGRLPEPGELRDQLRAAGYRGVQARSLLGRAESFFAFTGQAP